MKLLMIIVDTECREEVEVLFTLMAERYERKSMLITSNLVFSK